MMTDQQKSALGVYIANTAQFYSKEFSKAVVSMMVQDLEDLDFNKIIDAYTRYRRDGKNVFFPMPAKIRDLVNPTQSKETLANEAASRIRKAIGDFGWCNPLEARGYIGELGWAVVERAGGWSYVCENHGVDLNPLTFHAQARDLAKSMAESSELGVFDQPISLPKPTNSVLRIVSSIVKKV